MATLPLLIGLSGKGGSGKSTVAGYLAGVHGYTEFAFAAPLKEVVGIAFGFTAAQFQGELKEAPDPRFHRSPRLCLQHVGSACREIWPGVWVDALRRDLEDFWENNLESPVVISDVRFFDELRFIREQGGKIIRLERPGFQGAASGIPCHRSEVALDDYQDYFDAVISCADGPDALCGQVEGLLTRFLECPHWRR